MFRLFLRPAGTPDEPGGGGSGLAPESSIRSDEAPEPSVRSSAAFFSTSSTENLRTPSGDSE